MQPWQLFVESRPILAALVSGFGEIEDDSPDDVSPLLGDHGMRAELVHLHDEGSDMHSRATWRVKCPLSISVQILRHRMGSYNMVSGRYRTITQEAYKNPDDVREIIGKAGVDVGMLDLERSVDSIVDQYSTVMLGLKEAKKAGKITNIEYKRARECVRFALPEGRMTELYITYYLSDFYGNYKKLRDSSHAQTEHIWIAQEMHRVLEEAKADSAL